MIEIKIIVIWDCHASLAMTSKKYGKIIEQAQTFSLILKAFEHYEMVPL